MGVDLRRVVAVRGQAPEGVSTGWGLLITERLVLTSSALLTQNQDPVPRVRELVEGGEYAAEIAWSAPRDQHADGPALLRITDPAWSPPNLPLPRWGRWAAAREQAGCEVAATEPRAVPGVVGDPLDDGGPEPRRWQAGVMTFSANTSEPAVVELDATAGGEMVAAPDLTSLVGAAVLYDDLLVGVLTALDPRGGRMRCMPLSQCARLPGFLSLVAAVAGREPRFENCELASVSPAWPPAMTPSDLLRPEVAVPTFEDPDGVLERMQAWALSPEAAATMVLVGPPGSGKSRLCHELTARLGEQEWIAGFVARRCPRDALRDLLDDGSESLLLVVDDAHCRDDIEAIADLVVNRPSPRRTRIIVLARTIGTWWRTLSLAAEQTATDLLGVSLQDAEQPSEMPQQRLREAALEFETALRSLPGPSIPARPLRAEAAALAVGSQGPMARGPSYAALLAELVRADGDDTPGTDVLLRFDRQRWAEAAARCGFNSTVDIAAVAAIAHVTGPRAVRTQSGLLDLLCGRERNEHSSRERLATWLQDAFPGSSAPLYDCLLAPTVADEYVARALDRRLVREFLPVLNESGTEPALSALMYACGAGTETEHRRELARSVMETVAADSRRLAPAFVSATGRLGPAAWAAPALEAVIGGIEQDGDLLEQIARRIPRPAGFLSQAAVSVHRGLVASYRSAESSDADGPSAALASHLLRLADRLAESGASAEAGEVAQEAVELYRELARLDPAVHTAAAARALLAAAQVLDRNRALLAMTQSRALLEKLAVGQPADFSPLLARACRRAAQLLAADDRPQEAAVLIEQAASTLRQLSVTSPEQFSAEAAGALLERATILESCDRVDQAVEVTVEAVALCEQLADVAPMRFEPLCAAALSELSRRLADRSQWNRALVAAQRTTAILRRLYRLNRRGYLAALAESLLTLSERLSDVGRLEEAAERADECVHFLSLVEGQDPQTSGELAAARLTASVWLAGLGSWQASLQNVGEAVGLLRALVEQDASYSAALAAALTSQAAALGELGRSTESARTAAEAADLHRRTQDSENALAVSGLAAALTDLIAATSDQRAAQNAAREARQLIGRSGYAVPNHGAAAAALLTLSRATAAAESEISLELARSSLTAHGELAACSDEERRPPWRRALSAALHLNLAEREADARQFDAALAAADNALKELRTLAAEQPSAHRPSLAAALVAQSRALAGLRRPRDSVTGLREATEIHRSIADGAQALLERLRVLRLLADQLGASGAPSREIQDVLREAVAVYARVRTNPPGREAFEVADMLRDHAERLFKADAPAAVAAARQAVDFMRGLPPPLSPGASARLASSYSTLSWALHASRRAEDGTTAASSAVALRRALADLPDATPRSRELLARALCNLALSLEDAGGRVTEQLSAVSEAVTIYQTLAENGHPVVLSLTRALLDEAEVLRAAGYRSRARTSAALAVRHLRELAEAEPRRFAKELASALDVLSGLLTVRHRTQARQLQQEAAALRSSIG